MITRKELEGLPRYNGNYRRMYNADIPTQRCWGIAQDEDTFFFVDKKLWSDNCSGWVAAKPDVTPRCASCALALLKHRATPRRIHRKKVASAEE